MQSFELRVAVPDIKLAESKNSLKSHRIRIFHVNSALGLRAAAPDPFTWTRRKTAEAPGSSRKLKMA